jgi:hypothetical protein
MLDLRGGSITSKDVKAVLVTKLEVSSNNSEQNCGRGWHPWPQAGQRSARWAMCSQGRLQAS